MNIRFWNPVNKSSLTLPNVLHLIWLGSPLRPTHCARIKKWREMNKTKRMMLWVDADYEDTIRLQINDPSIQLCTIDKLSLSEKELAFINSLTQARFDGLPPNYAAVSDFLRAKILHKFGGWYVDTDIFPIELNSVPVNPILNFCINAVREFSYIKYFSPSVIACTKGNILTTIALNFFEQMITFVTEEQIQNIRSNIASVRLASTISSTGEAFYAALRTLKINGQPLADQDQNIYHLDLFDLIAHHFNSHIEQTWVLAGIEGSEFQPSGYAGLPGIFIDKEYLEIMQRREAVLTACPLNLKELLAVIYDKLPEQQLEIQTHRTYLAA